MLFNSSEFLFAFLPISLAGFYLLGGLNRPAWAALWLVLASLFFYGWWKIDFIPLLMASMIFNYAFGLLLARRPERWLLAIGIGLNIAGLGLFKYSGWAAEVINDLTQLGVPVPHFVLPLAISFYTFNQIAYLVDAYVGEARETNFVAYMLFVLFFPHLIAGPIVHHKEMLPQFHQTETYRLNAGNLVLGLTAFGLGLFKKVYIADPLAGLTPLAFGPAAEGLAPGFVDAWWGSLAYTLQIYFDFSGYSDMAIGLALMFNIRLPINFSSPFRAASIIDFWARWHMTLTRFLTSYIYNPIVMGLTRRRMAAGGKGLFNRNKPKLEPFLVLVAFPIIVTMTLAGVWHGAGWTFLVFGLWHGVLLAVNHGWRAVRKTYGWTGNYGSVGHAVAVFLTFISVVIGLVFFKSASLEQAFAVLRGMSGFGGEVQPMSEREIAWATMSQWEFFVTRISAGSGLHMVGAFLIVFLLPNVPRYIEQIAGTVKQQVAQAGRIRDWPVIRHVCEIVLPTQPSFIQGSAVGVLLALALLRAASSAPTEFLYFTF